MKRPLRLLEPHERLTPARRAWLAFLVIVQAAVLGGVVLLELARGAGL